MLFFLVLCAGCSRKRPDYVFPTPEPEPEPVEEHNPAIVALGWKNVSDEFGELPSYLDVYRSPATLENKPAVAFIAVADLEGGAAWTLWSIKDEGKGSSEPLRTPSEIGKANLARIVMNGGYFYSSGGLNYSASLAFKNGILYARNINYASKDWVTVYYPTRAAFIEHGNGAFEAAWTYGSASGHWMYPAPAENSWKKDPLPAPDASFPAGATVFEAKKAIGGGPVLIQDGQIRDTYSAEMLEEGGIGPTINNPRSAVGITAQRRLIFFVCEGRNMTPKVAGFTTLEVANILKSLGCTQAVNLDGGGSSCMLVNGKETIRPSDGSQRRVASAVMLN